MSSVEMQWQVTVPMRDGVCLSATLYLPREQKSPSPAVVVLTPYVRQIHHKDGVYFASHGFPFLTVDVRGRGDSEGKFIARGNEARDGYDIVEWIATQLYCNGKVAMWGKSHSGYVEWTVAGEAPPHLATIVPVAAPYKGVDSPMRDNIFSPYRIQWLTYLSGRAAQDGMFLDQSFWNDQFSHWLKSGTPFKSLDSFLGNASPIFQEWMEHPQCDAYWDSYNPTPEQYSKIIVPVLTITGAYDGNQLGALTHYREHTRSLEPESDQRHYLVIGPWDHDGTRSPKAKFGGIEVGPASLVDLPALHLQWYAWTMEDREKPEFLKKRVAYYVTGLEMWRYAESLEAVTARAQPLYLRSTGDPTDVFHAGDLTADPSVDAGVDSYTYDPNDVSLADLQSAVGSTSLVDQRIIHASAGKQLVYHSAPFTVSTEISGFFYLRAWIAIDQADTDFCVSVHEIDPSGGSIQLATALKRARYRESLREQRLISTRDPLSYEFRNFNFVSRQVRPGHRLRLVIGPLNSPYWEKNYNSGGIVAEESMQDARPVNVKLFHSDSRRSVLYVPLGHPDSEVL